MSFGIAGLRSSQPFALHESCRVAPQIETPYRKTRAARGWHASCFSELRKESAMVQGVITSKDVLWHTSTIVRAYGLRHYFRCVGALLSGQRTTFLDLVWSR